MLSAINRYAISRPLSFTALATKTAAAVPETGRVRVDASHPLGHLPNAVDLSYQDQMRALISHISPAIEAAKKQDWQSVCHKLTNPDTAKQVGVHLVVEPTYLKGCPDNFLRLETQLKQDSGDSYGGKNGDETQRVFLNEYLIQSCFKPSHPMTQKAQALLRYTHAINALEEWLHACQKLDTFSPDPVYVSKTFHHRRQEDSFRMAIRRNPEFKQKTLEWDVAAFLIENQIPLTSQYLARYERRKKLKGLFPEFIESAKLISSNDL